jgi:hypothetical protein
VKTLVAVAACACSAFVALPADTEGENTNRASMQALQIPSHGQLLNALVYVAAGAGPHPAVILLHGFPGNERNLDLAQDIRRAGWDVLYFNYRGSWGSPGDFSFSHGIEDTLAAADYLRRPEVAKQLRLDSAFEGGRGQSRSGARSWVGARRDGASQRLHSGRSCPGNAGEGGAVEFPGKSRVTQKQTRSDRNFT